MIQANTTNTSFLKMYYILNQMGVKNNAFFLQLYDETLYNVDPLDEEHLTDEQKLRIHIEISKNPWYFFREIIRFPVSDVKQRFELTRATLAIIWVLLNDLHSYVVIPRQSGKSYTVAAFYTWLIYWGSKNFAGTFFAQNESIVTQNLTRVKDLRDALPKYLNLKTNADTDNQHMLVFNPGDYKNTVITKCPGMNEDSANNVGRGNSTMGQWYDEFAFIPYIWIQFGAAIPAYSTVSAIAEKNGSHHHIIITTTAGNKKSKSGEWAYNFLNSCAPFTELLYDKCEYDEDGLPLSVNKDEIIDYIANNNSGQRFLRIEYQWYELSKPEGWLEKQREEMPGLDEFARGILNQWTDSNEDHPLGQERVQELMTTIIEPVKVVMVDKIYVVKYYRDLELLKTQSKHIVFGMDCSGNNRRDYSTLVGVDVTNSEVVCTMRVNGYSIKRFANAVGYILLYLFPESTLVGERNYVGKVVLEIIESIIGSERIYKDEKDGELGVNLIHKLRELMYGDIIRVSIMTLGKNIHDKDIINEVAGLVTTKNGRIDHRQNGGHDDTLISYLYCRWFITYCKLRNKYIDAVFFNSRLINDNLTESELEEMSKYSGDKYNYDVVSKLEGGYNMDLEKALKNRENSNEFVRMQFRNAVDRSFIDRNPLARQLNNGADDYYDSYEPNKGLNEGDISVDTISDEFKDNYHEYSENLDKDDPEKIAKETEEKRDKSEDDVSMFKFNFGNNSFGNNNMGFDFNTGLNSLQKQPVGVGSAEDYFDY